MFTRFLQGPTMLLHWGRDARDLRLTVLISLLCSWLVTHQTLLDFLTGSRSQDYWVYSSRRLPCLGGNFLNSGMCDWDKLTKQVVTEILREDCISLCTGNKSWIGKKRNEGRIKEIRKNNSKYKHQGYHKFRSTHFTKRGWREKG